MRATTGDLRPIRYNLRMNRRPLNLIRSGPFAKCLSVVAALFFAAPAAHALEPDEVVVLYNTQSPTSLMIARRYLMARRIPLKNLVQISCPPAETISELWYRTKIVPDIKQQLADKQLDSDKPGNIAVKCIVTTTDVPLRIAAYEPTPLEHEEVLILQKRLDDTLDRLEQDVQAYNQIALEPSTATAPATDTAPATTTTKPVRPTLDALAAELNTAASGAARRLARLPEAQRTDAVTRFAAIQERVTGLNGLLNILAVPPDSPNAAAAQRLLNAKRAELTESRAQYAALVPKKNSPRIRTEMLNERERAEGLAGLIKEINEQISFLQPTNTESCFDNELTMLFAPEDYPRTNWLANPKFIDAYTTFNRMAKQPGGVLSRTLMVSRIDGPDVKTVEAMIDTTLKVEAQGLSGKIYLDARGLRGTDPYSLFDADLRRAADWLKSHTTMDVFLDDKPELIKAADSPDCALYCGWYSVRNFQDSVQPVPGAVGYHVASYEMTSLHNPGETGWVPNLLKKGFCGTLGPTDEPYLDAFPKPSEFFPLLLSGQFTQGEVWQITEPWLSWRVGYVGDPLYNPFKAHPQVKLRDLLEHPVLRYAFDDLGRSPPEDPATPPKAP